MEEVLMAMEKVLMAMEKVLMAMEEVLIPCFIPPLSHLNHHYQLAQKGQASVQLTFQCNDIVTDICTMIGGIMHVAVVDVAL
jgi:hypothetical protein